MLVTAPINKNNIQGSDFNFCGHTEYLEQRAGDGKKALMILLNDMMRIALVTTHLPVKDIAAAITKGRIVEKAMIFNKSLKRDFRISNPRIAVLALNPHAGDGGLLGTEEQDVIAPAVKELSDNGVYAFGPYAADGFSRKALTSRLTAFLPCITTKAWLRSRPSTAATASTLQPGCRLCALLQTTARPMT